MDLKSFREDKLKIKTQGEFAELLEVDQSSISRWEKDEKNIPYNIIERIMKKTGATFEELTGWTKPVPNALQVKNTFSDIKNLEEMKKYIEENLKDEENPESDKGKSESEKKEIKYRNKINDELREEYIDGLYKGVKTSRVKPKIAIVGRSDTGKSTLINAVIGVEKMPTSWTPTTSIAVYIKHVDDRPEFMKEDDVWIFSNVAGDELRTSAADKSETMWDERRLNDEEYCNNRKLASGVIETLQSYGSRQGENFDKSAGSAVVFVDAPILKVCDIIDLPGFGTDLEDDDHATFSVSKQADIIIYLSQANGFMRIEDMIYLKGNICTLPVWEKKGKNELKPLSNLFVVASQAHTVNNGNRTQLNEILDVGCKNFLKTLPDKYWNEREKISGYEYSDGGANELRTRFFTYTTDIPDIYESFNESLSSTLELIPTIVDENIKDFVKEYVTTKRPSLTAEIEKYKGMIKEREKYEKLLEDIQSEENRLKRTQYNNLQKKKIRSTIKKLRKQSKSEFSRYIHETVDVDEIISLMDEQGVKNQKDSIEFFSSYFTSLIHEKCDDILNEKSEQLSEVTQEYIKGYSESISYSFDDNDIKIDFDSDWKFASAIAGIGAIGGYGAYLASSAYGVAALTSAGVAGTAAFAPTISFVSGGLAFGPIGIAIGIGVAVVIGLVKLFSGNWKKNTAKKIVEQFEKEDLLGEYQSGIDDYWDQTSAAFETAAKQLDKDWDEYLKNLQKTVDGYDADKINYRISKLETISKAFESLYLQNIG